jgi:ElaB/YqjD/DUF883 family membrane-anchored ribosome-binding protein
MSESEATKDQATSATSNGTSTSESGAAEAKSRFNKAIEEAKAGVAALKDEALERGDAYKAQASAKAQDWQGEARTYVDQAKEKAAALAVDGKARASGALGTVGKTINETAGTIDEKLGVQYGDYARTAAKTLQDVAAKIDEKDLGELGEDVRSFVRKSPGAAIGIAAVAGFFLARLLRSAD